MTQPSDSPGGTLKNPPRYTILTLSSLPDSVSGATMASLSSGKLSERSWVLRGKALLITIASKPPAAIVDFTRLESSRLPSTIFKFGFAWCRGGGQGTRGGGFAWCRGGVRVLGGSGSGDVRFRDFGY